MSYQQVHDYVKTLSIDHPEHTYQQTLTVTQLFVLLHELNISDVQIERIVSDVRRLFSAARRKPVQTLVHQIYERCKGSMSLWQMRNHLVRRHGVNGDHAYSLLRRCRNEVKAQEVKP